MAQDIVIRTLCDVCLSEDEERHDAKPFTIGAGPGSLEIDLCDVHAKPLVDLLEHARPVAKRRGSKAPKPASTSATPGAFACPEPGCDRTFDGAQGLSMHRTRSHGLKSETREARRKRGEIVPA